MNWGVFGLVVSGILFILIFGVFRRGWGPVALLVAATNWAVASINSAAPFRGLIDPDYVGYAFGLLQAERGLAVTGAAGLLVCGGTAAAALAARRARGPAMLWVAGFDAGVIAILGWPLGEAVVSDPASITIQFGEYLTIPAGVALPLLAFGLVAPLLLGVIWSLGRLRPA